MVVASLATHGYYLRVPRVYSVATGSGITLDPRPNDPAVGWFKLRFRFLTLIEGAQASLTPSNEHVGFALRSGSGFGTSAPTPRPGGPATD